MTGIMIKNCKWIEVGREESKIGSGLSTAADKKISRHTYKTIKPVLFFSNNVKFTIL